MKPINGDTVNHIETDISASPTRLKQMPCNTRTLKVENTHSIYDASRHRKDKELTTEGNVPIPLIVSFLGFMCRPNNNNPRK